MCRWPVLHTRGRVMADWGSLPSDIVRLIADKLSFIEDFAALSSVCRSYKSAADKKQWRRPDGVFRPPWLLLGCQDNGGVEGNNSPIINNERGFLNMYKNMKKSYLNLPELHGRRCWGSPHGWIVTLGLDRQLHLFNPLTRRHILLPQPDIDGDVGDGYENSVWMRKMFIDKAILIRRPPGSCSSSSSSVVSDDFIVITIGHKSHLRVLRHQSWETVKFHYLNPTSHGLLYDVVYHNGQIYVLGIRGSLYLLSNMSGSDPLTAQQWVSPDMTLFPFNSSKGCDKLYLVEYFGDLIMVVRIYEWLGDCKPNYKTEDFEAYKFNHDDKKWIELEDLGDWALFVGSCESIPLPQPEIMNCRSNSIYFTDDYYEQFSGIGRLGGHDMGIYNYENMSIDPLYNGGDSLSTYCTPTWLIPSFT